MTKEQKRLREYRDDRKYIPVLLSQLQSEELKTRAANEVCTYVYSAYKYKRRFYSLTVLSVLLPAVTVTINSIDSIPEDVVSISVSLLSMVTVVVTGVMSTMKARESWVRNREYAERAKTEISNCLMGTGIYDAPKDNQIVADNERKLAERLEELYAEEQGKWKELRSKREDNLPKNSS